MTMSSIAELANIQKAALISLNQRMAEFESLIKKSATPVPDLKSLSNDFQAFKDNVWQIMSLLHQKINEVSQTVDNIEMRHRRKYLLLHGVPESSDENILDKVVTVLQDKLQPSEFASSSIVACHRLGAVSEVRARPVLIRFSDQSIKSTIWAKKTQLRGTSYVLSEFLTRQRQILFIAARKHFGIKQVWSLDGNIHVKLPSGKRHRLTDTKDLDELIAQYEQSAALDRPSNSTEKKVPSNVNSDGAPKSTARPKRIIRNK